MGGGKSVQASGELPFKRKVVGVGERIEARAKAARIASAYLSAIPPFHTYLESDLWQQRAARRWDGPPDQMRLAVSE
jgi:hypothetical protein